MLYSILFFKCNVYFVWVIIIFLFHFLLHVDYYSIVVFSRKTAMCFYMNKRFLLLLLLLLLKDTVKHSSPSVTLYKLDSSYELHKSLCYLEVSPKLHVLSIPWTCLPCTMISWLATVIASQQSTENSSKRLK